MTLLLFVSSSKDKHESAESAFIHIEYQPIQDPHSKFQVHIDTGISKCISFNPFHFVDLTYYKEDDMTAPQLLKDSTTRTSVQVVLEPWFSIARVTMEPPTASESLTVFTSPTQT